jgi:trk system potassium uptake protein TrkA
MAQQILIIGLGQFGMSLARTLSEKGAEVLAVDVKKSLVEEAAAFVTEAVIANAADETELARLEPGRRDSAVCAIGDDSREASIICTALLRQMGVPVIISRANDAVHQRILQLVGAHQIINPEHEFGKRFANRLLYKHVITDTNIGESLHLTEILMQPSMVGKTLVDLELPKRYGVLVVGIRRGLEGKIHQPSPVDPLLADDHLIIVSRESAIPKFIQGV